MNRPNPTPCRRKLFSRLPKSPAPEARKGSLLGKLSPAGRVEILENRIAPAAAFAEFIDPNPSPSNGFGSFVVPLSTGNVVITAPFADVFGIDSGAVYLFDGETGALISTLYGASNGDQVGSGGVVDLGNGNFVVSSPNWTNDGAAQAGAATWGSGVSGVSGLVSDSNSLVGTTAGDRVSSYGVTTLGNGNYLVLSFDWDLTGAVNAGAVTWGSGSTGVAGTVGSGNSLVGGSPDDQVGFGGVKVLGNGNYVVSSPGWDHGIQFDVGAATWGSGTVGVSGLVSAANSLVGTTAFDYVGLSGIKELSNGNYVVLSPNWNNDGASAAGAVTWGSGTAGVAGAVTPSNSLVGTTAGDRVGSTVITLNNGNYVAISSEWDNGMLADTGAVTWASGAAGLSGPVGELNSLVGTTPGDLIGIGGLVELTNGNFVVSSIAWNNGATLSAGAATWVNGTTGLAGPLTLANSLAGGTAGDGVGLAITPLTNGNYVVSSPFWDNGLVVDAGAVTWGSGTLGIAGLVTSSNSLVGSTTNDRVGNVPVAALSNGNYVVASSEWDNGGIVNAGAATWGDGTTGIAGPITSGNSLVGGSNQDRVGVLGIVPLSNGNYVVRSILWDHAGVVDAGAVTWGNGTTGVTGFVTALNSLVGTTANDLVGALGVVELANGNYVVLSPDWDNGAASNAGAATWGSGTAGVAGVITASNSLVGSTANNEVSRGGVLALSNGNYVVASYLWDNGVATNAGAVTWGDGSTGVSGVVSAGNSLVGDTANDVVGNGQMLELANGNYVVRSAGWHSSRGHVTWGSGDGGLAGVVSTGNSLVGVTPGDAVGGSGITILDNGGFLARSAGWDNGVQTNAGAVTWGSGTVPLAGTISSANSLIGGMAFSNLLSPAVDNLNHQFYAPFQNEGKVRAGSLFNGVAPQSLNADLTAGTLTISELAGADHHLTAIIIGTDLVISDPLEQFASAPLGGTLSNNGRTLTIALSAITGGVIFNTGDGDDSLTIDFDGGLFTMDLTFNGGNGADTLTLSGGSSFATVTHTFTSNADGSVNLTGNNAIQYTGLAPIFDNLSAVDRVFTYTGAAEAITLSDVAPAGVTRIDSTLGESVDFVNPIGSITINASNGTDTVSVDSIDAAYTGALTIVTDGGDTATIGAGLPTLASLSVTAASIHLNSVTTVGAQSYTGAVTLDSTTTLTTTANSAVTFTGTVNGAQALVVNSTGATTFTAVVGGVTPLTSLTTDAGGTVSIGGNVTTTGAQSYGENATMAAATLSTTNSLVQFGGTATLTGNVAINSGSGGVTFASTVDGTAGGSAETLSITAPGGTVTFSGAVGSNTNNTQLEALTINSAATVTFSSTIQLANALTQSAGSVSTTFGGAATVGSASLTGTAFNFNAAFSASGSTISITNSGAVSGTGLLTASTLNLAGGGAVGASGARLNTTITSVVLNKSGGNTYLQETNALTLSGTTGGDLDFAGNGIINQAGPLFVAGTTTAATGAHPVLLTNAGNDFTGAVSISNGGLQSVAVVDINGLIIGTINIGTGSLGLVANGITQTGIINQFPGAVGSAITGGTGSIVLNLANNFAGPVTTSTTGAGASITLNDTTGGLEILSATTTDGAMTFSATSGDITLTSVTAGGTGRNVSATTTTSGNIVVGTVTAAGDLVTLTSAGNITDGGGVPPNVTAGTLVASAATGIGVSGTPLRTSIANLEALASAGGVFISEADALNIGVSGGLTGVSAPAGNVVISSGALTISEDITTPNNVTLTSTGTITEAGGAVKTAAQLLTSSVGGQTLLGANTVASLTASNATSGNVQINNTATTLTVESIANSVGGVYVNNAGSIGLKKVTASVSALAEIIATGAISDVAGIEPNVTAGSAILNSGTGVGTGDRIELAVSNLEAAGGTGGVFVTNSAALTIGGITGAVTPLNGILAGGQIDLITTGAGSNLTIAEKIESTASIVADEILINAFGSITETTGFLVTAVGATANLTSRGGQTLNNAGNQIGIFTALNTTGGGVSLLNNRNDFIIQSVLSQTGGAISIVNTGTNADIDGLIRSGTPALGGSILVQTAGLLTVDANVNSSNGTGGTLTLGGLVLVNTSPTVGFGSVTLQGGAGPLTIIAPITVTSPLILQSTEDVNILAKVETTSVLSDITVLADMDNDGDGGVLIAATGSLKAGRNLDVRGSAYLGSEDITLAGPNNSIIIQPNGSSARLEAIGNVLVKNNSAALATAQIWLGGLVRSNTNGDVAFDSPVLVTDDAARVLTHGTGNVIFVGAIDSATTGFFDLHASTDLGVVLFNGPVGAARALGDVTVDSTLDLTIGDVFNAGSLTVTDATGTVDIGGAVTLTNAGLNLSVNAVTLLVHAPVNFTAPGASTGDAVLQVNNLDIASPIAGDGVLTIQQRSAGRSIGVSSPVGDLNLSDAELDLLADGFSQIVIGRANDSALITIGARAGVTDAWLDPVVFRATGSAGAIDLVGSLEGTSDGGFTFLAPKTTVNVPAGLAITTEGGGVAFGSNTQGTAVTLLGDLTINTGATGGDVLLVGTINGNFDLGIDAGEASVTVNGNLTPVVPSGTSLGGTTALSSVTISGGALDLRPNIRTTGSQEYTGTSILARGGRFLSIGTGDITFNGPLALNDVVHVSVTNGDILFDGTVDNSTLPGAKGSLVLAAGAGTITFTGAVGAASAGAQALRTFEVNSASLVDVNGAFFSAGYVRFTADEVEFGGGPDTVHAGGVFEFRPYLASTAIRIGGTGDLAGSLDLSEDDVAALADGAESILIATSQAGQPISVIGPVTFHDALTIQTNVKTGGNLTIGGAITTTSANGSVTLKAPVVRLGADLATEGGSIDISNGLLTANVTLGTGTGTVTLRDKFLAETAGVTLTIEAGSGNINILSKLGGKLQNPLLGAVTLETTGVTTIKQGGFAESLAINGGGGILLTGKVQTHGEAGQSYGGPVTLTGAASLVSTHAQGAVEFAAGVNSALGKRFNLTLTNRAALAGDTSVVFASGADAGVGNALNNLSIQTRGSVEFGGGVNAVNVSVKAGTIVAGNITAEKTMVLQGEGTFGGDLVANKLTVRSTGDINSGTNDWVAYTSATFASKSGNVVLEGDNEFAMVTVTALDASVKNVANLVLGSIRLKGTFDLDVTGGVTQATGLRVIANKLQGSATGSIALTNAGNALKQIGDSVAGLQAGIGLEIRNNVLRTVLDGAITATTGELILVANPKNASGSFEAGSSLALTAGDRWMIYSYYDRAIGAATFLSQELEPVVVVGNQGYVSPDLHAGQNVLFYLKSYRPPL